MGTPTTYHQFSSSRCVKLIIFWDWTWIINDHLMYKRQHFCCLVLLWVAYSHMQAAHSCLIFLIFIKTLLRLMHFFSTCIKYCMNRVTQHRQQHFYSSFTICNQLRNTETLIKQKRDHFFWVLNVEMGSDLNLPFNKVFDAASLEVGTLVSNYRWVKSYSDIGPLLSPIRPSLSWVWWI